MTPSNPIGKGTKNLMANLPEDLYNEIKALADASGMSVSRYTRTILEHAAQFEWRGSESRDIIAREARGEPYGKKKK